MGKKVLEPWRQLGLGEGRQRAPGGAHLLHAGPVTPSLLATWSRGSGLVDTWVPFRLQHRGHPLRATAMPRGSSALSASSAVAGHNPGSPEALGQAVSVAGSLGADVGAWELPGPCPFSPVSPTDSVEPPARRAAGLPGVRGGPGGSVGVLSSCRAPGDEEAPGENLITANGTWSGPCPGRDGVGEGPRGAPGGLVASHRARRGVARAPAL